VRTGPGSAELVLEHFSLTASQTFAEKRK